METSAILLFGSTLSFTLGVLVGVLAAIGLGVCLGRIKP